MSPFPTQAAVLRESGGEEGCVSKEVMHCLSSPRALRYAQATVACLLHSYGFRVKPLMLRLFSRAPVGYQNVDHNGSAEAGAHLTQMLADLTSVALRVGVGEDRTLSVAAAAAVAEVSAEEDELGDSDSAVLHSDLLNDSGDVESLRSWCRVDAVRYFTSPRTLQLADIARALVASHVCEEAKLVASLARYPKRILLELCCLGIVTPQWHAACNLHDAGTGIGVLEDSISPAQSAVIEALLKPQPLSGRETTPAREGMWELHPALATEVSRYSFSLCRCMVEGFIEQLVRENGHRHSAAWGRLLCHLIGQGGAIAAYGRAVADKYGYTIA